jgi:dihydrofolate reductase
MVIAAISMSVDGFVTGPQPDLEHGLGNNGESLHAWSFDRDDEVVAEVVHESLDATGAVVMGRRTFDFIDGPNGWGEDRGYDPLKVATPPGFVVTHSVPRSVRLASQFTFVTTGLEDAIDKARAVADEQHVVLMGGGDLVRQAVSLGLLDELRIHLAPVLLGSGTPLFTGGEAQRLVQKAVRVSSRATHLTYSLAA